MLICITVRKEIAEKIKISLDPLGVSAQFEVSLRPDDDEMTTVEVNFEEERDVTPVEAVAGIMAFYLATKDSLY